MSRFTKVCGVHNNEPTIYEVDISKYPNMMGYEYKQAEMDAINKLGELEDLEDKLGISLVVLFKTLKGIWSRGCDGKPYFYENIEIQERGLSIYCSCGCNDRIDFEAFEDYGKTWALTREELENEEH